MARHTLTGIVLLATALHVAGIARTLVPAQDGLKFIRVARAFGQQPWTDVIRGSDQHPLYPAGIALVEPAVSALAGPGPDAWRIAAQVVSMLASVALLLPLYGLTRHLFDERTAGLTALLYAVLPAPCAIGHDTLSDALALALFTTALWAGERALRLGRMAPALGCGLAAGLGYWTRPEVAFLPAVVLGIAAIEALPRLGGHLAGLRHREGRSWGLPGRGAVLAISFLAMVGGYALVKGEVSEKLALRRGAALSSAHDAAKPVAHWLPPGLDDPRFDFAPKEEGHPEPYGPVRAIGAAAAAWGEGLGWAFAPLAVLGALRVPARSRAGRRIVALYVLGFGAILVRHAMGLGYLSGRHAMTLVVATLPWAAAGTLAVARRVGGWLAAGEATHRILGRVAVALLVLAGVALQARPAHASRWGHHAAGRWLAAHAEPGAAVLDTRGWAAFVSGMRSYDVWHIRQALTDAKLGYVVVGADELRATSRRGATLRTLLGYAARPVAAFPDHRGDATADVLVYRFEPPESWEGIRP